MTRKKKLNHKKKSRNAFSERNEKNSTTSSLVLFTVDHNWVSTPSDVIEAFRLSLPLQISGFWEVFATECLDAGWWSPPFLVGPISWEKDARKDKDAYIAFLRRKNDHYQFFLNIFACNMLALEEIVSSPSSVSWNSDSFHSYLEIPGDTLFPWWEQQISEIVRSLQEGKEIGFYAEQKGRPRPQFTFYYDNVSQPWWSQFCWKILLRDLFSVQLDNNQWIITLPAKIAALLPDSLKDEFINHSKPRWKSNSLSMGIKVIGIDNVLICAVGELETRDPHQNEVFQIPWIEIERHLLEENPSEYPLSVDNLTILEATSHYVTQQLNKFIRLILAQAPSHLIIILEQFLSLDFGVFQEEADLRYDIATKRKLGELILEKIDKTIASINDPRIKVEWVDSSGAYEVCSVCGQPYDGTCPHFPRHQIADLTPESTTVDIAFEVLRKISVETVTSKRSTIHRVAEYLVGDETGQVVLSVWDDDIERIEVGKAYLLKGGKCKSYQSALRLVRGKGTFLPLKEMVWLPKKNDNSSFT